MRQVELVHVEVSEKAVLHEHVDLFDVLESQDGQGVGRPVNRVPQQQLFEVLVALVLREIVALVQDLPQEVVANLHDDDHLVLGELGVVAELEVVPRELLDRLLLAVPLGLIPSLVVHSLVDASRLEPIPDDLVVALVTLHIETRLQGRGDLLRHLPVGEVPAFSVDHV